MEVTLASTPVRAVVLTRSEGITPPGLERRPAGSEIVFAWSAPTLRAALDGTPVLFAWDFRSPSLRQAWDAARDVRWIHVAGVGVDGLLFPELVAADVTVTNSAGVFDAAIGEYAVGLMLAFAMDLPRSVRDQATRRWEHRETERLAGRTVVVLGAGGIGRAIASLARAAGCQILSVAREARTDPDLGRIFGVGDLASILPLADFVVVALPLTAATRGLVGAAELRRLRPSARIINVGRGPVVDEDALVQALERGIIAGAALDVFDREPLPPEHPFWDMRNVIVSPHMSGDFGGYEEALSSLFLDQLSRYQAGTPLINVVDTGLGFVPGGSTSIEGVAPST
jgi:phosphoglycerate dehydrogenase-like enzyme